MNKRLLLLGGIAILCVVLHHAYGTGQIAMFLWTDQYRDVTVPNWDQLGTLPYYVLLVLKSGHVIGVPAFIFIAGFFAAYAARSGKTGPSWKMVWARISALLVPYLIWSGVVFGLDALLGTVYPPGEYLLRLFSTGAGPGLWYVPLLCYLYLLSPFLVPMAKTRRRLLLFGAALIQLGTTGLQYLRPFRDEIPGVDLLLTLTPSESPARWIFFFALGMVASLHNQEFKQWLAPRKWFLLVAAGTLYLVNLIESDLILRLTQAGWHAGLDRFSYHLCAVACILCFLAFEQARIPGSQRLYRLGMRSFGIYLLHPLILEIASRGIRQVLPQFLAYPVLFGTFNFALALGGSLLLMELVAKSPARKYYRYLFG